MRTYHFTIILAAVDVLTEDMAEAIFAAGCDDCSPGSGGGIVHVRFHRQAKSLELALSSAMADVNKAGYSVAKVEFDHEELTQLPAVAQ